jgi:hypothetical protein
MDKCKGITSNEKVKNFIIITLPYTLGTAFISPTEEV